ncbi:MAG: HAD-IA family hydrolase [Victivallales bacterium]|jgi:phosphoglycolate phosphatase
MDKKSKHPLLLCDLDGTLIDSREDLATGVNLMRADYGLIPLSVESVTGYVGDGARKLVERALPESVKNIEEAIDKFKRYYQENMFVKTRLYPTVAEGLRILHGNGWKLALTSNKPSGKCEDILRHFGVGPYFDLILGASDSYPLKPDPESIFIAMRNAGSDKSDTWIIGDNHTDLEAGRRAGIRCCYAKYVFGNEGSEKYDMAVDSFMEFVDQLQK